MRRSPPAAWARIGERGFQAVLERGRWTLIAQIQPLRHVTTTSLIHGLRCQHSQTTTVLPRVFGGAGLFCLALVCMHPLRESAADGFVAACCGMQLRREQSHNGKPEFGRHQTVVSMIPLVGLGPRSFLSYGISQKVRCH